MEETLEEKALEIAKEAAKEVAKDVYNDGGKPVLKPSGELIGLVPRAIKAAFEPLEQWIMQKEYSIARTKILLEDKLKNTSPEMIQPPEPHIAVPALQYLSYCMDNEELREMYANLLANSMNAVVKNGVHPGFVEIIKQLCPDEAKILKYMSTNETIPTISLRYEDDDGVGIPIVKNFSTIGELTGCESPYEINKYFDNLIRLGLVGAGSSLSHLAKKELYKPLKEHPYIVSREDKSLFENTKYTQTRIVESYVELTDFGRSFCDICLDCQKIVIMEIDAE